MARKENEKASEDALEVTVKPKKMMNLRFPGLSFPASGGAVPFFYCEYLFKRKHTTWRKRFLGFLFLKPV